MYWKLKRTCRAIVFSSLNFFFCGVLVVVAVAAVRRSLIIPRECLGNEMIDTRRVGRYHPISNKRGWNNCCTENN